jgi:hypothetical protein
MADLNLRNLPAWLIKRLKVQAAKRDLTLRAHCIEMLAGTAAEVSGVDRSQYPGKLETPTNPLPLRASVDYPGKIKTPPLFRSGCPSCGALTGHQKWCKR